MRVAGVTLVVLALCAAPANAAYTASAAGTTATFTGDNNFNQLVIQANTAGTLLQHSHAADPGFASSLDFDTSQAGDQTLPNSSTSIFTANGGTGLDAFQVFSGNSGRPVIQAELNYDGGAGQDFPLDTFMGDAVNNVTVGGGSISGVAGVPIDYANVDGAVVRLAGGNDTLVVVSSPTVGPVQVFAGDDDDTFIPAEGTNLGHRFDAGAGNDTVDYSGWTSAVNVGTPMNAAFEANLTGAQQNPPVVTANTGEGTVFFDDLPNVSGSTSR